MRKNIVFNFHKEENGPLFEQIIVALKSRYRMAPVDFLEQAFDSGTPFENICHITFDDGEKSFYNIVYPILKKHQVPVTLFVSPGMITSGTNYWFQEAEGYDAAKVKAIIARRFSIPAEKLAVLPYMEILKGLAVKDILNVIATYQHENNVKPKPKQNMTTAQLKEVEASGLVAIGAHTLNHPVLKNEDDAGSREEISGSIKELADLLGHPVKYFAYPNGRPEQDFSEREINYLKENNIRICFSTELNHFSVSNNPLAIPRMGYPTMGLKPGNPLIHFRLSTGNRWIDIKSIFSPSEKKRRQHILSLVHNNGSA